MGAVLKTDVVLTHQRGFESCSLRGSLYRISLWDGKLSGLTTYCQMERCPSGQWGNPAKIVYG